MMKNVEVADGRNFSPTEITVESTPQCFSRDACVFGTGQRGDEFVVVFGSVAKFTRL